MSFIILKLAETEDELSQILELQSRNHVHNLSKEDKKVNGFVTVKHDLALLTQMNNAAQQVIAKDGDIVVGYALVMLKEFSEMVPVLVPMFEMFNTLFYKDQPLSTFSYYVMGQICVSEHYRGMGVFENMYLKHKEIYLERFEICLTEVSTSNARSMKAHVLS